MRSMVRENHVRTEELIYPLFVMEGENIVQPVESMPGICQYSVDRMNEELDRVKALQIPAILIFGIPEHKDEVGSGAYDEHGIVQTAIRRNLLEARSPDRKLVIADVCLCENFDGHYSCQDEFYNMAAICQIFLHPLRCGSSIIYPRHLRISSGRNRSFCPDRKDLPSGIFWYMSRFFPSTSSIVAVKATYDALLWFSGCRKP